MEVLVNKISKEEAMASSFHIRHKVFVEEQHVDEEEEYDEFEDVSTHVLATIDGNPAGTGRWRFTDLGIKLERFSVLEEYRSYGIGSAIMRFMLEDIAQKPESEGKTIYLHAQLTAMGLYTKFGFVAEGSTFQEAGIDHFKMIKRF
ncbi:Predicted N-acyltransferase, GNAT family [Flexibacter flexilis DSM 6793]|uniref:Predicted N-acyltransferase, GNAT family n=1 Tax=Flexibacter flexilis DSM 6793 TaxID=927664 RepID=A0A1I1ITG1_9BACT|nr:GNAT family N-acetyltransferase [Flexibacter flexilis]SFC39577.1 Predicted N-acyltransferase, GNAT family [Flexibacter flexilis DSM 6793]